MPNTLGRNLNLCFTKIKMPLASQSSTTVSTPTSPNPDDQSRPFPTNTASTTSTTSILIKNFNSLYEYAFDSTTSKSLSHTPSSICASEIVPVADFATAFASQRFFFSTPGSSNSIIESTKSTTSPSTRAATLGPDQTVFNNSVAVPTFSPDPYVDFRRSMQEMVEARELMDVKKSNWEFLHELLLCYLTLNPKSTHKFIIGAFSDLVVSLMPSHPDSGSQREADDFVAGVCEISRQCT
ncbi:hypothetical protein FNV43_RR23372 [Rhamnella rubrinervis]|uniref:Transcription repressor n=1 Tax=Rhamnella rubrinervis TaxID=2594499 RepID=A0A8K0DS61_9ROSA|nr:hypothetical protein FNV43_RR23372 [Rhamnella rubrinervis]